MSEERGKGKKVKIKVPKCARGKTCIDIMCGSRERCRAEMRIQASVGNVTLHNTHKQLHTKLKVCSQMVQD